MGVGRGSSGEEERKKVRYKTGEEIWPDAEDLSYKKENPKCYFMA